MLIISMLCTLILVKHGLPADFLSVSLCKESLSWSGTGPYSLLAIVSSHKSNTLIILFMMINSTLYWCKILCVWSMCNCSHVKRMKVKVPDWDALTGLAGPHPIHPFLRCTELGRGEGGGAANGPCPAWEFWTGGLLWQLKWTEQSGVSFWCLDMATQMGGPKWRFIVGEPIRHVLLAGFEKR